jgi:HK97 family phage major capsid protein
MGPMPAVQALLEERANVWSSMTEIIERAGKENRDLTVDERQTYDNAEVELDRLTADIARQEKHEQRAVEMAKVDRTGVVIDKVDRADRAVAEYESAFDDYLRHGFSTMSAEHRTALQSGFTTVENALTVGTGASGGYTVPPGFRDVLIETQKWYGSVRDVATVIQSDSGQPLQWPTNNATTQVGRILSENTALTQTDPAFNTATLGAYMYSSDLVLVPYQFLQDSAIDAGTFLARILGVRIGRIQNQHFTTGTGTAQPLGIQTNATTGATLATGNTTSLTYAGLISLIHSVDPAYRYGATNGANLDPANSGTKAKFMLSDTALAAARSILDSQNRPLWQPSLQAGVPDSLMGYSIVVNNDMPVPAANAKSVLFGDFERGYVIRDVVGLTVRRLDERYADALQVGWFAFQRTDATVQDSVAYKALVQSAT